MRQTIKYLTAVSLLAALCSTCGGGGGGGDAANPAPTLVAATFLGAGSDPVAGDRLRLVLSEAIQLAAGVLDDGALTVSGGGSLGAVTGAPTVLSSNTVEVVLGAGVALVAGTTTIDFGVDHAIVRDVGGLFAVPGTARTMTKADADVPVITGLTASDVDGTLNGTGAAGGRLQVPNNGFTIDISYTDLSAIDPAASVISANLAVLVNGVNVGAGNNIAASLVATASAGKLSYLVPPTVSLPTIAAITLTVQVADITGQTSAAADFTFAVRPFSAALQPFESGQTWFLDTVRDVESYTVNLGNPTTPITIVNGPSGRSDLIDLLYILGLQHTAPIANVDGAKDSNEVVRDRFEAEVLAQVTAFFPGVNIGFTFTSPGTFPSGSATVPYASFGFSQICVAGSLDSAGNSGVLGLAVYDEHNTAQVDDCTLDFGGNRLGVFLHTLINSGFLSSPSSTFRSTFDTFAPSRTNQPIGSVTGDGQRLMQTLTTGQRYTDIHRAIDDLGRFTALIIAHECGHSMGLVKGGAMPNGLYGGDATNFPGSQAGHISMPGALFPGSAINIMTPAISYPGALDAGSGFNSLNLAYLRERVIYN